MLMHHWPRMSGNAHTSLAENGRNDENVHVLLGVHLQEVERRIHAAPALGVRDHAVRFPASASTYQI